MATMKMTGCLAVVAKMPQSDQDALLARVDQYKADGIPAERAQVMAANDVLAEIRAERTQLMSAIAEQHPDLLTVTQPQPAMSQRQVDTPLPRGYVGPVSEEERKQGRLLASLEEESSKAWNAGAKKVTADVVRSMTDNLRKAGYADQEVPAEAARHYAFSRIGPGREYDDETHPYFSDYRAAAEKAKSARAELQQMVDARIGPPEFEGMRQLADFDRAQVRTPKFRFWFKNSKVVDAQGRPLIVFHGTNKDLTEFATVREGGAVRNNNWFGQLGSWFAAPQPDVEGYEVGNAEATADVFAELRGDEGSVVYPVYLSIQNPYEVEGYESLVEERDDAGGAAAFRAKLIEQGYDGVVVRESDTDGGQIRDDWVAFYPTQIKSATGNSGAFDPANPDIRRSARQRNALGLYSALAEGVEGIKTNTAPAAGWRDAIKGLVNKGAVKADEVEWSGVNDWLALQQGKVSKDAVVEYLRGNGVKVEETVLGETLPGREMDGWLDRWAEKNAGTATARAINRGLSWNEIVDVAREEGQSVVVRLLDAQSNPAKYDRYTLPGGENYREVLLALPETKHSKTPKGEVVEDGKDEEFPFAIMVDGQEANRSRTGGEVAQEILQEEIARVAGKRTRAQQYKSSHWDQPNVLAHIRVNDRTDVDGNRVLFVEEIQSDWGQEGKKRGFAPQNVEAQLKEGEERMRRRGEEIRRLSDRMAALTDNELDEFNRLADERQRLQDEQGAEMDWGNGLYDARASGVPAAPFVTAQKFAVFKDGKEVTRTDEKSGKEVKQRYDSMEAAQAAAKKSNGEARDLGLQANTEGWLNLALKRVLTMAVEGGYDRVAFTTGAQNAERFSLDKTLREIAYEPAGEGRYEITATDLQGREVISEDEVTLDRIEQLVGKEIAEKIARDEGEKEDGGYRDWRYLRGDNLKVEAKGMRAFYDTIVPNAVRTLAKKLGGQVETVNLDRTGGYRIEDDGRSFVVYDPQGNVERRVASRRTAEQVVQELAGGTQQPGLVITDAMREKVGEGLPMFSRRQRQAGGIVFGRDELGRVNFAPGAKAYDIVANVANNVLDKIAMKPVSEELGRAMRNMKVEVERVQNQIAMTAKELAAIPQDEREMISDVIEGELRAGIHPPQHVLQVAASMQSIMSEQSRELVRLGMLSQEAANRWDQKYLPRFYESKLGDEITAWAKAAKALFGRQPMMQGIRGSSLKARGMFETIDVADLPQWLAQGWEQRDANFDPATSTETVVWRDYSRKEREDMGEIRDAMFRFVMGYNRTQRDVALGRLYESLAQNYASAGPQDGYVLVPDTKVEGTMAARYGKLAGKYVPKEVMDHLSVNDETMMEGLFKIYKAGLSKWKEGKTVLNPVSHANNVISNLTMAHFAGVSYWDVQKYAGAVKDLVTRDPMVAEAKDIGLFGGTFSQSEIVASMPPQLRAMAGMSESKIAKLGEGLWDILAYTVSWNGKKYGARPVMQWAYENEDLFFRYLVYRDARGRGMAPEDAREYAQQFLFTYDDLPKGARTVRDVGLPFFSYTYKVVPVLARTALEYPWRYAAPAVAAYAANAMMYAMAASMGGDDDDWWGKVLYKWVTDKKFRERARALEDEERKNLPPWMKGGSAMLGTPKAVRLGMDSVTGLPMFLDISRMFPGGDLLDAQNNAGGVALLQPLTPSNPVLTTTVAMLANKDMFFGRDVVKATDTDAEKAQKRAAWLWKQVSPAIAVGNYHFDRGMNVIANITGKPITVDAGPLGVIDYTGTGRDGLPVQPGLAALQTMGIKVRPYDLDTSEQMQTAEQKKLVRELTIEIKRIDRLENKGAISPEAAELMRSRQQEKRARVREGLTVDGEERK